MSDRPSVTLRPVASEDSADLLAWRNDPLTRSNSRSTDAVTQQEHAAWLSRVLAEANRQVWIAMEGDDKVGTTSAVLHEDGAVEVSVTVAPAARGRRLAAVLVAAAVEAVRDLWPTARIRAEIKPANTASRRAFEACGFEQVGDRETLLDYELPR
jgi:RimJ/RimL family protein N-acetyltransferase